MTSRVFSQTKKWHKYCCTKLIIEKLNSVSQPIIFVVILAFVNLSNDNANFQHYTRLFLILKKMAADLVMESDPDIGRSRLSLVCRLVELISGENSHKKVTKFCNVTFLIASHCCNSASVQLIEIILVFTKSVDSNFHAF